ncbi:MAG: pyrimidine dimer DNA glycosylase/endonuclease V [Pseudomonadota bacterium]
MRLWSLHPRYLDAKGIVALWREALLAKAVLSDQTKGYRKHPQLERFKAASDPVAYIAAYLGEVHSESLRREYRFDASKVGNVSALDALTVTQGQMDYEWRHLLAKLESRDRARFQEYAGLKRPLPHPLFRVVAGDIAAWEVIAA